MDSKFSVREAHFLLQVASGKRVEILTFNGMGRLEANGSVKVQIIKEYARVLTHTIRPSSIHPSTSIEITLPFSSFPGSIVHAHSIIAKSMKSELFATCFSHTDAPPKTVRDVTFLFRFWCERYHLSTLVQEPRWVEVCGVGAVDFGVAVEVPNIGYHMRALRNEHAVIPVIFRRAMRQAERGPYKSVIVVASSHNLIRVFQQAVAVLRQMPNDHLILVPARQVLPTGKLCSRIIPWVLLYVD